MDDSTSSGGRLGGFAAYAWMVLGCFVFAWMGEFAYLLGTDRTGQGRCDRILPRRQTDRCV